MQSKAMRYPSLAGALTLALTTGFGLLPGSLHAQWDGATMGPVIPDFGPVFDVQGQEVPVPTDMEFKVLFDIAAGTQEPGGLSAELNTVARYINMNARAGVPLEQIKVAVVLHGLGSRDVLGAESFEQRFGVENPNIPLVQQLAAAGVQLYICGQSAMVNGYTDEELLPEVQMALSAMTMRTVLQNQGYEIVR